jgi:hypothetical protein
MKQTNDQCAAPPFDTRDERARISLKNWTIAQLRLLDEAEDAGRRYDLLETRKGRARREYSVAKSSARRGNLARLREFLVRLMDDPEIAQFIAEPRRPRGRRRPQMAPKQSISFYSKHLAVVTVKRVRQIWERQYHKWKRSDRLAIEIAANYCEVSEEEVEEALKRRLRTSRPAK